MRPVAVCTSRECGFVVDLWDLANGRSLPSPRCCPQCGAATSTTCPMCGFLLLGAPGAKVVRCQMCQHDLQRPLDRWPA